MAVVQNCGGPQNSIGNAPLNSIPESNKVITSNLNQEMRTRYSLLM